MVYFSIYAAASFQMISRLHMVRGYMTDSTICIHRLLAAGCHEEAYQIFLTNKIPQNSEEAVVQPYGNLFIESLVKLCMVRKIVLLKLLFTYCYRTAEYLFFPAYHERVYPIICIIVFFVKT